MFLYLSQLLLFFPFFCFYIFQCGTHSKNRFWTLNLKTRDILKGLTCTSNGAYIIALLTNRLDNWTLRIFVILFPSTSGLLDFGLLRFDCFRITEVWLYKLYICIIARLVVNVNCWLNMYSLNGVKNLLSDNLVLEIAEKILDVHFAWLSIFQQEMCYIKLRLFYVYCLF